MTKVRILAAVVNTTELVMYKENGDTITIPQGDPRVLEFIEAIKPNALRGLVTEIELGEERNTYKEFEDSSQSGAVKFFRVAKSWIKKNILGEDSPTGIKVSPQVIGDPLQAGIKKAEPEPVEQEAKIDNAIDDIMANAKSVQAEDFTPEVKKEETVIAVVTKGDTQTVIPHVENLTNQLGHAAKHSTIGMEKFLERLSAVINERGHSVKDLLEFLSKGDLPIADDGCIVAYKVLDETDEKGIYVDCHTKKVRQKVGSYVHMQQKLVDPNRRNDCSNGLHIARRDYVGKFTNHVNKQAIVICKIPPENAIAVPEYDKSKIRVMGYHIVGLLPASAQQLVKSNEVMTGTSEAAVLLNKVLRGEHIGIIQNVEITQQRGEGVVYTDVEMTGKQKYEQNKLARKLTKGDVTAEAVEEIKKEAKDLNGPKVDPKDLATQVAAEKNITEQRQLFNNSDWAGLYAFKAKKKQSWSKLGFTPKEINIIEGNKPKTDVVEKATTEPVKKTAPKEKKVEKTTAQPVSRHLEETREEKARKLYELATKGDKASWGHLWLLKRTAKKSWTQLGFTSKEAERITTNKPDHI